MSRKRGLGRGLDALLPKEVSPAPPMGPPASPTTLLLSQLEPNRHQPRERFDEAALAELADSIRAKGLIQPVVVTPVAGDRYTLVAGERRWRAAKLAGLTKVPVVVREVKDDQDLLELALVENLQRSDLDPVEEAVAYQTLRDQFGLSQQEIGDKVGKSRPVIANALRLLNLPEGVLELLRSGALSVGQARPMLALGSAEEQLRLAREAIRKSLTARDLEALVASGEKKKPKKMASPQEVHAAAAAERLTQALHTRVDILRKGRGGQVRVHFHSEEELMRIYDLMVGRGDGQDESN